MPGASEFLLPLIALAAAALMGASLEGAPRSARAAPEAICLALGAAAFLQFVRAALDAAPDAEGARAASAPLAPPPSGDLRPVAVFALMMGFAPVVGVLGFLAPSLAFVAGVALICGERPGPAALLAAASVGGALGLMWVSGFYFPLI